MTACLGSRWHGVGLRFLRLTLCVCSVWCGQSGVETWDAADPAPDGTAVWRLGSADTGRNLLGDLLGTMLTLLQPLAAEGLLQQQDWTAGRRHKTDSSYSRHACQLKTKHGLTCRTV